MPAGSQLFFDGCCLSHSWPTIQAGRDKLYVLEQPVGGNPDLRPITLTHGTYNAMTLAAELQSKLNLGTTLPGTYTVSVQHGRLTIANSTTQVGGEGNVRIYSRSAADIAELVNVMPHYTGGDICEIIGLWERPILADGTPYIYAGQSLVLSYLDLQSHKVLYLCSPGLGASTSLDCRGNTDVVRRILLGGSQQGDIVTDVLQTGLDCVHFDAYTTLQLLHFQVKGWDDQVLNMAEHQISFSILIE